MLPGHFSSDLFDSPNPPYPLSSGSALLRCSIAGEIPNLTRGEFVGFFIAMCIRKMMIRGGFLFLFNAEATLNSPFRASISRWVTYSARASNGAR